MWRFIDRGDGGVRGLIFFFLFFFYLLRLNWSPVSDLEAEVNLRRFRSAGSVYLFPDWQ